MKIPNALTPLVEAGVIEEVIRPLMSGKEAAVYLVVSEGEQRVAKVYKQAQERSFRQRAAYSEGRTVRNSRQRRAMAKGSRYGKQLLEQAWQAAEVDALVHLHGAGVRVPIPYHFADDVLVMELVKDEHGEPAPRLYDVRLGYDEALAVHQYLLRQVVVMLCAGMVHGDLSEYNILMAADGPVIIDLPQACDAAHNRNAGRLLKRDVKNLGMYLGRYAHKLRRTRYGPEIWGLYERGKLHPDSELTGRFDRRGSKADTAAVLAEIEAAMEESQTKPVSSYRAKKEAQRREQREAAEREATRKAAREEQQRKAAERKAARGQDPPAMEGQERAPRKRRRRRRRRRGGSRPAGSEG